MLRRAGQAPLAALTLPPSLPPPHPLCCTALTDHLAFTAPRACAQVASAIVTARKMSSLRDPSLGVGWRDSLQQTLRHLALLSGLAVHPVRRRSNAPRSSTSTTSKAGGGGNSGKAATPRANLEGAPQLPQPNQPLQGGSCGVAGGGGSGSGRRGDLSPQRQLKGMLAFAVVQWLPHVAHTVAVPQAGVGLNVLGEPPPQRGVAAGSRGGGKGGGRWMRAAPLQ